MTKNWTKFPFRVMAPHQGILSNKVRNMTHSAPFLSARWLVRSIEIRMGTTAAVNARPALYALKW